MRKSSTLTISRPVATSTASTRSETAREFRASLPWTAWSARRGRPRQPVTTNRCQHGRLPGDVARFRPFERETALGRVPLACRPLNSGQS
jgi:hypothetical protein